MKGNFPNEKFQNSEKNYGDCLENKKNQILQESSCKKTKNSTQNCWKNHKPDLDLMEEEQSVNRFNCVNLSENNQNRLISTPNNRCSKTTLLFPPNKTTKKTNFEENEKKSCSGRCSSNNSHYDQGVPKNNEHTPLSTVKNPYFSVPPLNFQQAQENNEIPQSPFVFHQPFQNFNTTNYLMPVYLPYPFLTSQNMMVQNSQKNTTSIPQNTSNSTCPQAEEKYQQFNHQMDEKRTFRKKRKYEFQEILQFINKKEVCLDKQNLNIEENQSNITSLESKSIQVRSKASSRKYAKNTQMNKNFQNNSIFYPKEGIYDQNSHKSDTPVLKSEFPSYICLPSNSNLEKSNHQKLLSSKIQKSYSKNKQSRFFDKIPEESLEKSNSRERKEISFKGIGSKNSSCINIQKNILFSCELQEETYKNSDSKNFMNLDLEDTKKNSLLNCSIKTIAKFLKGDLAYKIEEVHFQPEKFEDLIGLNKKNLKNLKNKSFNNLFKDKNETIAVCGNLRQIGEVLFKVFAFNESEVQILIFCLQKKDYGIYFLENVLHLSGTHKIFLFIVDSHIFSKNFIKNIQKFFKMCPQKIICLNSSKILKVLPNNRTKNTLQRIVLDNFQTPHFKIQFEEKFPKNIEIIPSSNRILFFEKIPQFDRINRHYIYHTYVSKENFHNCFSDYQVSFKNIDRIYIDSIESFFERENKSIFEEIKDKIQSNARRNEKALYAQNPETIEEKLESYKFIGILRVIKRKCPDLLKEIEALIMQESVSIQKTFKKAVKTYESEVKRDFKNFEEDIEKAYKDYLSNQDIIFVSLLAEKSRLSQEIVEKCLSQPKEQCFKELDRFIRANESFTDNSVDQARHESNFNDSFDLKSRLSLSDMEIVSKSNNSEDEAVRLFKYLCKTVQILFEDAKMNDRCQMIVREFITRETKKKIFKNCFQDYFKTKESKNQAIIHDIKIRDAKSAPSFDFLIEIKSFSASRINICVNELDVNKLDKRNLKSNAIYNFESKEENSILGIFLTKNGEFILAKKTKYFYEIIFLNSNFEIIDKIVKDNILVNLDFNEKSNYLILVSRIESKFLFEMILVCKCCEIHKIHEFLLNDKNLNHPLKIKVKENKNLIWVDENNKIYEIDIFSEKISLILEENDQVVDFYWNKTSQICLFIYQLKILVISVKFPENYFEIFFRFDKAVEHVFYSEKIERALFFENQKILCLSNQIFQDIETHLEDQKEILSQKNDKMDLNDTHPLSLFHAAGTKYKNYQKISIYFSDCFDKEKIVENYLTDEFYKNDKSNSKAIRDVYMLQFLYNKESKNAKLDQLTYRDLKINKNIIFSKKMNDLKSFDFGIFEELCNSWDKKIKVCIIFEIDNKSGESQINFDQKDDSLFLNFTFPFDVIKNNKNSYDIQKVIFALSITNIIIFSMKQFNEDIVNILIEFIFRAIMTSQKLNSSGYFTDIIFCFSDNEDFAINKKVIDQKIENFENIIRENYASYLSHHKFHIWNKTDIQTGLEFEDYCSVKNGRKISYFKDSFLFLLHLKVFLKNSFIPNNSKLPTDIFQYIAEILKVKYYPHFLDKKVKIEDNELINFDPVQDSLLDNFYKFKEKSSINVTFHEFINKFVISKHENVLKIFLRAFSILEKNEINQKCIELFLYILHDNLIKMLSYYKNYLDAYEISKNKDFYFENKNEFSLNGSSQYILEKKEEESSQPEENKEKIGKEENWENDSNHCKEFSNRNSAEHNYQTKNQIENCALMDGNLNYVPSEPSHKCDNLAETYIRGNKREVENNTNFLNYENNILCKEKDALNYQNLLKDYFFDSKNFDFESFKRQCFIPLKNDLQEHENDHKTINDLLLNPDLEQNKIRQDINNIFPNSMNSFNSLNQPFTFQNFIHSESPQRAQKKELQEKTKNISLSQQPKKIESKKSNFFKNTIYEHDEIKASSDDENNTKKVKFNIPRISLNSQKKLESSMNDFKMKDSADIDSEIFGKKQRKIESNSLIIKSMDSKKKISLTESAHFVFCLDDSGSMRGKPWKVLKEAVKDFMISRKHSKNEKISIIQFNSKATLKCEFEDISNEEILKKLKFNSGGTNFGKAINLAYQVINRNNKELMRPILILVTDGRSSSGENEILNLANKFNPMGLQIFLLLFHSHYMLEVGISQKMINSSIKFKERSKSKDAQNAEEAAEKLKSMAALSKGTFLDCKDSMELKNNIFSISAKLKIES